MSEKNLGQTPAVEGKGLSKRQNRQAEDLAYSHRFNAKRLGMAAADALESGRRSRDSKRESDVSNWVGDHALFEAWDKVTREQVRDAQRHYRRHEAGYQTQAAKEAQAAGVETDFGQRVKQPGHAAQEKDTTVAD